MVNWQRCAAFSLCFYCILSLISAMSVLGDEGEITYLVRLILRLVTLILIAFGLINDQAWARWSGLVIMSVIFISQVSGLVIGVLNGPYQQFFLGSLSWATVFMTGLGVSTLTTIIFLFTSLKQKTGPLTIGT